ncbi:MAG: 4a-hydroxytetrahydrobiopterin dehydratase [Thermaerobacter sp.]|nr:4a-hydroxytetrahydrobiopterin dehydratase [Thermaerobacter sp.]
MAEYTIPAGTDIGHVHLTVSDLARSEAFYCGILGFRVMQRWGDEAVFMSAGGYHHHIAVNTWAGKGAPPPPEGATGLYHLAIRYPTRRDLANALLRLMEVRYPIDGASDHLVSEAIYLRDPDGNGVEIYRDRDRSEWPRENGEVRMGGKRLDLDGLLAQAGADGPAPLNAAECDAALKGLPGWEGDPTQLRCTFRFASFPAALAFVDKVGGLAEDLQHHPDIDIRYRTVHLALSSHDAGGVTQRDLELAKRISAIA